jgi:hypothetical protein
MHSIREPTNPPLPASGTQMIEYLPWRERDFLFVSRIAANADDPNPIAQMLERPCILARDHDFTFVL